MAKWRIILNIKISQTLFSFPDSLNDAIHGSFYIKRLNKNEIFVFLWWQWLCAWDHKISRVKLWIDQPHVTGKKSQPRLQESEGNGFFCETWGRKAEQLVEKPYEMRKRANLRILVFLFLQQSFCLGFFLTWLSLLPTAAVLESALCLRPIYLMKFSWLDLKLLELVLQSTCMVRVRGRKSFTLFYQKQTIFHFRPSHNPHACLALLLEARSGSPTTLMAE